LVFGQHPSSTAQFARSRADEAKTEEPMCDQHRSPLRIGDPVRLKDSDLDLRGDVWQLRTGYYVVVRWEDDCRSTHSAAAIEYDTSRGRAEWSRKLVGEDR
jgi:hypothetical protein